MSGEFGRVTVIVLQKVSIDRNVGSAMYDSRERPVRLITYSFVSVIDFAGICKLGDVHRRGVHLVRQYGGERAVLSDVFSAVRDHHCWRSMVNEEPQREPAKVFDLLPKHFRYHFQRFQRYAQEPAIYNMVDERIE